MKKALAAALLAVTASFASTASAHDWAYITYSGKAQPQYQLVNGYTNYRPYYGGSYRYTPRHYGRHYSYPSYGYGYSYPSYGYPAYGYGYTQPYTTYYGGYYGGPSAGLYFRF